MKLKIFTLVFFLLLIHFSLTLKIGIVGAGIGSGTFSHYFRKFSKDNNAEIDVYESRDYIGGKKK